MHHTDDWRLFVQAVNHGSFAAAARHLGVPKSTVSKRVALLEASLGARLLNRTSRSFVLTDVGKEAYEHAQAAMIEVEAAENAVQRRRAEPSGNVKLTASVPTAQYQLAPVLPQLAFDYPKLRIQVHVTDRFVDLMQEGFDIAVRNHFLPLPDSGLVQRRVGSEPIVLVASPSYLQQRKAPRTPNELSAHDGLMVNPDASIWQLSDSTGIRVEAAPLPRFFADESATLLAAAQAGLGIAALPISMVASAIQAGLLRRILEPWQAGTVTTSILTSHRRDQLPAVRAVINAILGSGQGSEGVVAADS